MNKEEIVEKYERMAPWYDLAEGLPELLGIRRLRRRLLQRAGGRTLEVAVGTGKNLRYYPPGCEITAVDMSPSMLGIARKRAGRLRLGVEFKVMDAEALDFPNQSFDTVVSTLTLCTFSDPVAALKEMSRVCSVNGRILLLEHGRSNRSWLASWQDKRAESHAKMFGDRWNREPSELVVQAGLKTISTQRLFLGIFHVIEARPSPERRALEREEG